MSESNYAKNPTFHKKVGYGCHGTSPESALKIHDSQVIKPSTNGGKYKPWYGEGIYLYEDGIYPAIDSARHYVLEIKKKSEVTVVKARYRVEKLLDFTVKENFDYLLKTLIPKLAASGKFNATQIGKMTPHFLIELMKKLDPDIDAIRGASFEGEGIGMEHPLDGNLIIDVQLIICLLSNRAIDKISFS